MQIHKKKKQNDYVVVQIFWTLFGFIWLTLILIIGFVMLYGFTDNALTRFLDSIIYVATLSIFFGFTHVINLWSERKEDKEQIELILSGNYFDALQWAIQKLGLSSSLLEDIGSWEKYDNLVKACWPAFVVSRWNIDQFVSDRGWHPNHWYQSRPSSRDGIYFIEEKGVFHLYHQERGIVGDHVEFPSIEAAMPFVLNEIIGERRFPHLVVQTPYSWSVDNSWQPERG